MRGEKLAGPRTFPHLLASGGRTSLTVEMGPRTLDGRPDGSRSTLACRDRRGEPTSLRHCVESRCHLPERTALTFGALRDSNFRTANGVMTGPEHIVDSGRRPQILNGHAEAPPPARPWDAADPVSDHMTLRIHEEQTTYRCSALAVENPHLLLVVARAGDRSFSSVSTKR